MRGIERRGSVWFEYAWALCGTRWLVVLWNCAIWLWTLAQSNKLGQGTSSLLLVHINANMHVGNLHNLYSDTRYKKRYFPSVCEYRNISSLQLLALFVHFLQEYLFEISFGKLESTMALRFSVFLTQVRMSEPRFLQKDGGVCDGVQLHGASLWWWRRRRWNRPPGVATSHGANGRRVEPCSKEQRSP